MPFGRLTRILLRSLGMACTIFALYALLSAPLSQARAADNLAYIRIIHASPDVGTVDVFVDGSKILGAFQYSTVTNYVPLPAGTHNVQIALIGKGVDAAVITQELSVNPNTAYTIAAVGTKATKLSLITFVDDNSVVGNGSKLRVYHLSPGTGTANVTTNGQTVASDLSYQQASDYISLPADTYTFTITVDPQHVTQTQPTTLKAWNVTSIFVVGLLNNNPNIQVISSQQQGVPGMPNTGSDPRPLPQPETGEQTPTALILLFCLLIASAFIVRRRLAYAKRLDVVEGRS